VRISLEMDTTEKNTRVCNCQALQEMDRTEKNTRVPRTMSATARSYINNQTLIGVGK
jgi:hypothetical protein